MKKLLFSLISLLIGLGLFFWILNHVGFEELKKGLFHFSLLKVIFIISLGLLTTLLGTLRWKKILKYEGYAVSFKELFGNYLAGFAITYLVPIITFGGEIFRGYALKDKKQVAIRKGMAASFIEGIFEYIFEWLAIFLGLGFFFFKMGFFSTNRGIVFLTGFVFLGVVSLFVFIFFQKKSFLKFFLNLDENNHGLIVEREVFSFFELKNRTFQAVSLLSLVKALIKLIQYGFLVSFLGEQVSIATVFAVLGVSILAMSLPVSADIGTLDFVSVLLFKNLGMNPASGIVFASIIRTVNLTLSLIGIFFLIKFSFESLRSSLSKKVDKFLLFWNLKNSKINKEHEPERKQE